MRKWKTLLKYMSNFAFTVKIDLHPPFLPHTLQSVFSQPQERLLLSPHTQACYLVPCSRVSKLATFYTYVSALNFLLLSHVFMYAPENELSRFTKLQIWCPFSPFSVPLSAFARSFVRFQPWTRPSCDDVL